MGKAEIIQVKIVRREKGTPPVISGEPDILEQIDMDIPPKTSKTVLARITGRIKATPVFPKEHDVLIDEI